MNEGKWIVRGASLALVMGFFMPAVLVSCSSGYVDASQSFSLSDIADQANQGILYLLPFAAIVAAILTTLKAVAGSQQATYLWGQLGAMAIGTVTMVASLISLNDQISRGTYGLFEVKLAIGSFIILGGIIAFFIGWSMQKQAINNYSDVSHIPRTYESPYPERPAYQEEGPPIGQIALTPPGNGPYLDVVSGNLRTRRISLPSDQFAIGRGSDNHLQLPDRTVSRIHALIRPAQGMWFLQDQESSGGTFVNGTRTPAARLNDGDEIDIGPFKFIFHRGT